MRTVDTFRDALNDPDTREQVLLYMGQVPIFAQLAPAALVALACASEARTFDADEMIFAQDEPGDDLHMVLEGTTRLIRRTAEGKGELVATRGPGESFGEIGFLSGTVRNLTAVNGDAPALHLVLRREAFDCLIDKRTEIGIVVFRHLVEEFNRRMEWVPPLYRNYLMWGYRPPAVATSPALDGTSTVSRAKTFALAGALWGLVASGAFYLVMWQMDVGVALAGWVAVATFTAAGAMVAAVLGGWLDEAEERLRLKRKHARCCANCRFVVWEPGKQTAGCLYRKEHMDTIDTRPGIAYDTFCECPSFDPLGPEAIVRYAKRDAMGKD